MPAGPAADTTACADPVAMVEAWKAAGSTAPDLVVLAVVESLARRAAAMPDEAARQWLVQRIQDRMTGQALGPARPTAAAGTVARPGLTALGELIDRLGRAPQATPVAPAPSAGHRGAPAPVSGRPAAPLAPAGVGLKSVTAFHGTWSRLRAEQRLRQALAQVPLKVENRVIIAPYQLCAPSSRWLWKRLEPWAGKRPSSSATSEIGFRLFLPSRGLSSS